MTDLTPADQAEAELARHLRALGVPRLKAMEIAEANGARCLAATTDEAIQALARELARVMPIPNEATNGR